MIIMDYRCECGNFNCDREIWFPLNFYRLLSTDELLRYIRLCNWMVDDETVIFECDTFKIVEERA